MDFLNLLARRSIGSSETFKIERRQWRANRRLQNMVCMKKWTGKGTQELVRKRSSKETRRQEKTIRCVLANGSAWSAEKKDMEKTQGHLRHLLWDQAQDEEGGGGGKVQQRRKAGWRFAADAARITDESTGR